MPAAYELGLNAKLSYQAGGQAAGSTYTVATNVRDLTLNMTKSESDASTRGGGGWKATVASLTDASIAWNMVADNAADFLAMKVAFMTNAVVALKCLDKTSGAGLLADFQLTKFERTEPIEGHIEYAVEAKITYSATAPSWIDAS